eukprot:GHVQ01011266.1.p1 GENE.GHVQ01011266.1~~GHVQ01011266.1.p1  ORF type:complete len:501 (-),score=65.40 GHVQ01011266.1:345-1847(-)
MSLVCSISGFAPEEPVLSPGGYVFEKRLIMKEIEGNGKCPITGQHITKEDLLDIHTSKVTKPRPLTASSVPGLLSLFQNEWDALMSETFALRSHLDKVRNQLSQSLYQHDAATRVIARLLRERDTARQKVAQLQQQLAHLPDASARWGAAAEPGISEELMGAMQEKSKELLAGRKKRHVEGVPKAEDMKTLKCTGSHPLHSSTLRGVKCVDIDPNNDHVIATGGVDGVVCLFDIQKKRTLAKLQGHMKSVNCVKMHPRSSAVLSCSHDKTIRIWNASDPYSYFTGHTITKHTKEVLDLSIHPLGGYFVSSSADNSWAFYEIDSGKCLRSTSNLNCEYRCLGFHPDGMILGGGGSDGGVHIWDLKAASTFRAALTGHDGPVTAMSFSENGFYMATASEDGTVRFWDLRKSLSFQTIKTEDGKAANNVNFDFSGQYVAVASTNLSIYNFESRAQVGNTVTLYDNSDVMTDAKFGPKALYVVGTSMDRDVRIWETQQQQDNDK